MNRLIFALTFVCTLLAAALVAVMMNESRLEKENAELVERLNEKRKIVVSIDVRGDWVYAEAYVDGRPAVEVGRPISEFGLSRNSEKKNEPR